MKRTRLRPVLPTDLPGLPKCLPGKAECSVPRGTSAPWAVAATEAWGCCGVLAVEDEQVVGHLLVTLPLHIPSAHPLAAWSRTPDNAAVLELWCSPDAVEGTDRHLVQALAARLSAVARSSGLHAIEACSGGATGDGVHCLDAAWAESVGFRVVERRRVGVRLRLDLDATVGWRPGWRSAWELLTGWVDRPVVAEPSSRGVGQSSATRSPSLSRGNPAANSSYFETATSEALASK